MGVTVQILTYWTDNMDIINQQLHGYGARQIAVIGTPPLGCVPSQRTIKGGLHRDCAQELNYASQLFNAKLFITLDQLAHILPNSNVFYIDIYSPFSDIAENSQDYGNFRPHTTS